MATKLELATRLSSQFGDPDSDSINLTAQFVEEIYLIIASAFKWYDQIVIGSSLVSAGVGAELEAPQGLTFVAIKNITSNDPLKLATPSELLQKGIEYDSLLTALGTPYWYYFVSRDFETNAGKVRFYPNPEANFNIEYVARRLSSWPIDNSTHINLPAALYPVLFDGVRAMIHDHEDSPEAYERAFTRFKLGLIDAIKELGVNESTSSARYASNVDLIKIGRRYTSNTPTNIPTTYEG